MIPPILAVGGLAGITFTLSASLLAQAAVVGIFGIETRRKALDSPEVSARAPGPQAVKVAYKVAQQG